MTRRKLAKGGRLNVNPFGEFGREKHGHMYDDGGPVRRQVDTPMGRQTGPSSWKLNLRAAEDWKNKLDQRDAEGPRWSTPSRSPFDTSTPPVRQYRRGGRIKDGLPRFDFGGLFSPTPSSQTVNQTTNANSNSNFQTQFGQNSANNLDPAYWDQAQNYLARAQGVSNLPYPTYPTDQRYAALTPDQQLGYWNTRQDVTNPGYTGPNQQASSAFGNASSAFGNAGNTFGQAAGINPVAMAQPSLNAAGSAQTGMSAAQPYLNSAGKSWTDPGVAASYMSPYTSAVTDRIAQLGARNLSENLLPQVNDVFTGAQFGRSRNTDFENRAVRDENESVLGQQAQALESGYTTASNIFGSDAGRAATLAGTSGQLAIGDKNADTSLAATTANIGQNAQAGLTALGSAQGALGNAQGTLGNNLAGFGSTVQGEQMKDNAAIMASGNSLQQYNQLPLDFNYNQAMGAAQQPYTDINTLGTALRGLQIPTSSTSSGDTSGTSQTQSTSNTTGTQSGTAGGGSPFGQVLGGVLGAASLAVPGASGVSALGNIFGSLGGGGFNGGSSGGTFNSRDGGPVPFAVGGMVPTVNMMRKNSMQRHPMPNPGMPGPAMPGAPVGGAPMPMPMQGRGMRRPGMMPTGMPGMPPAAGPRPPMATPFARGGFVEQYGEGGGVLGSILGSLIGGAGGDMLMPILDGAVGSKLGGWGGKELGEMLPFAHGGAVDCHKSPIEIKLHFADGGSTGNIAGTPASAGYTEGNFDDLLNTLRRYAAASAPPPPMMPSFGPFGSANGATGNNSGTIGMGDVGVGGTGGVGGSASSEAGVGGSAAAGVGGDDGGTYADGGPFDRPMPFGPGEQTDMGPTGRDAVLQRDPLAYLWGHVPENIRDAGSFARDMMPDRSIGSVLNNSGRLTKALMHGRANEALDAGTDALYEILGTMVPGGGRATSSAVRSLMKGVR